MTLSRIRMSLVAARGWGRRGLVLWWENWNVRGECIQLSLLDPPAILASSRPRSMHRCQKGDIIEILRIRLSTPFHFLRHQGYRHPVNRFASSPCRMAHLRSRFPMDNNTTFNGGAGKTPTGDTRGAIAAAVSRVITLCMCEGTVWRAFQQVHRKFGEFAAYQRLPSAVADSLPNYTIN